MNFHSILGFSVGLPFNNHKSTYRISLSKGFYIYNGFGWGITYKLKNNIHCDSVSSVNLKYVIQASLIYAE